MPAACGGAACCLHVHVVLARQLTAADEELPITLQLHPELLADERIVQEYTWHSQLDCRRAFLLLWLLNLASLLL